jgi:regulator of protease activity HflC (stomatin/prohibitin superfamily)
MSQDIRPDHNAPTPAGQSRKISGCLTRLSQNAATILVVLIIAGVLFSLTRAAIYKIRPYERGLHLRGGRFISVDQPGWHVMIPFVDTVITVMIIERSGTIEKLAAMTADNVTMDITLLYTYRVVDPVQYQLEVLDPDHIVAGFVQGALRDLVNTRTMDDMLRLRTDFNQELLDALREREQRYGIEFLLVQVQNASPPEEVVNAIKEKMVALQMLEKATSDAEQQRTLADSEFYAAQKKAEGEAYMITKIAEAEAQQVLLISQARVKALQAILDELAGRGSLAEQYIQVLIAQELSQNSKWIISNGGAMPIVDLREPTPTPMPTSTP